MATINDQKFSPPSLTVAFNGCCHGSLTSLYSSVLSSVNEYGRTVDVVVCCGDFQSCRDSFDVSQMACPVRHRRLNDFHEYYLGIRVAPILTIFIGGNHEASNYLQELYFGGWVAHNIYFMGFSSVINICGLRFAGISGIYKSHDHEKGYYECPPYDPSALRSIYHTRAFEVWRLSQYRDCIDICLSHDWPRGVAQCGDTKQLLKRKPFFAKEINTYTLGSPCGEHLLRLLRPKWWFSGHLHVKHSAIVFHQETKAVENKTEASSSSKSLGPILAGASLPNATKFLALDKCGRGKHFLQIVSFPIPKESLGKKVQLEYDCQWLAILRRTHSELLRAVSVGSQRLSLSFSNIQRKGASQKEMNEVRRMYKKCYGGDGVSLYIPPHFDCHKSEQQQCGNSQTDAFLSMLDLSHPVPFIIPCRKETIQDSNEIDIEDI
eukprot:g1655.t1